MRILFLYTELADYTLACLRALKKQAPQADILVVHFPVNAEAPFKFDFAGVCTFICINEFKSYHELRAKVEAFAPQKIVCCGWVNKWYIRVCYEMRRKARCIMALDNHWHNTPKQQLLRVVSRVFLKKVFTHLWVPGEPQVHYGKKLGYKERNIITGFYCCDLDRFNNLYHTWQPRKVHQFPRRFLCVARYIPQKNYNLLWRAFIAWQSQQANNWELWCAGTGELFDQRIEHPAIRHLGFVQKDEWEEVIGATGIFILPSLSEPWAVAVHEFAAAGFPLLLSNRVGAATRFLSPDNGFSFDPTSEADLVKCFEAVGKLTNDELNRMGAASNAMAQSITPAKWTAALLQVAADGAPLSN